ncbi:LysR family transcriptional regulator [Candidatus Reidiella endopervernicosa]|uniref:LysR family transcriptional regulator n=1 Tax=Candidatus Reidiella endopervernicosa TaxID=2738883 RepID=A0A6N0HZQ3_9GAMM|nr:LysR family transcriptional regulator [Candidatus Reidiella endopervernicosa]
MRAVVERGGVEEAAQSLHVGQPAVTKRLRALDTCYGIKLMQREGRRLELTPAGKRVYSYARLVLDHQTTLLDDLEFLQAGQNRLRLEVNFSIGEHLLPTLLIAFAEAHPEYRIESRMGYTRRIQTRLATGMADLALLEQAPDHPDVLVQKWLDDELLLVCGRATRSGRVICCQSPIYQSSTVCCVRRNRRCVFCSIRRWPISA